MTSPFSRDTTPTAGTVKQSTGKGSGSFSNLSAGQVRADGHSLYANNSAAGCNSYGMPGKQQPSNSMPSRSMELVQIKPNVWLPLAAVQQAGGDPDLALHLLAQGDMPSSHTKTTPSAADDWDSSVQARHMGNNCLGAGDFDSAFDPNLKCPAGVGSADSSYSTKPYNVAGLWDECNGALKSSTMVKNSSKSAWGRSGFDPVIQPPTQQLHTSVKSGTAAAAHRSATGKQASAGFSFTSPIASMPYFEANYISPECNMDSSSLFSYGLTTPEQVAHSRPDTVYTTPEASNPRPTMGWGEPVGPQNPKLGSASAYGGLNPSVWQKRAEGLDAGSVSSHSPFYWSDPTVRQLLPDLNGDIAGHSNIAANMGAQTAFAPGSGMLCVLVKRDCLVGHDTS